MLTVLAGLAEFERELIRARTERRPRPSQSQRREARAEIQAHAAPAQGSAGPQGERRESLTEIARSYNVSHSTISRLSA